MWQEFCELRKEYLDKVDMLSESYRNDMMVNFLYETLRLANNSITKQEFIGMIVSGKRPESDNGLKAYDLWKAFLFTREQAEAHEKLSLELIQKIASKVMKHTGREETTTVGRYDTSLGDFRLGEDYDSVYPIADFRKIPEMLETVCQDINTRIEKLHGVETVRLAADCMYDFAHIKPFGSGNLETGLLVTNYIQSYHNEPLIIFFNEERPQFLNALKRGQEQETPEVLENFTAAQQMKFFKRKLNEKTK